MVKTYSACTTNKKPELLNDILQETEELIKIFVTSIKAAEKKQKWLLNVRYLVFVFIRRWTFDLPAMPLGGLGRMPSCVSQVTLISHRRL